MTSLIDVHELQLTRRAILDKHALNAVRTHGYHEYDGIVDTLFFAPIQMMQMTGAGFGSNSNA
jgi:hypothetical protein